MYPVNCEELSYFKNGEYYLVDSIMTEGVFLAEVSVTQKSYRATNSLNQETHITKL